MCDFKRSPPCFWCCCGFRADTQSEQWKEFGCPASSLAQQNCHHHQKQDLQAAFELLQIGDGSCQADRRTYQKTIKLIKPRHTNIARYRGSMKTTPLNLLQRCIAHLLSPFLYRNPSKSLRQPISHQIRLPVLKHWFCHVPPRGGQGETRRATTRGGSPTYMAPILLSPICRLWQSTTVDGREFR